MKIIKIKIFVASLLIFSHLSCSTADNVSEIEKETAINNGDFVLEPKMHYIVDGELTSEVNFIKSKIQNAPLVYYNYVKNKVIVCTNYDEISEAKKTNPELNTSSNDAVDLDSNNSNNHETITVNNTVPTKSNEQTQTFNRTVSEYRDMIMAGWNMSNSVYLYLNIPTVKHVMTRVVSNTNLYDIRCKAVKITSNNTEAFTSNAYLDIFSYTGTTYPTSKLFLINETNFNQVINFYAGVNYQGKKITILIAPGTHVYLNKTFFKNIGRFPLSWKTDPFTF